MAVTINAYLLYKHNLANGGGVDLDTDTIRVALLTGHTPDLDAHEFFDDVSGDEVAAGDGYTAEGAALGSPVITDDTGNNRVDVDYANVTWTTVGGLSSEYAVVYKDTGTPGTSRLIALIDFGATVLVDGLTFNAAGLLRFA